MNVYNLKRDDIFNTVNSNSTRDIDFNSQLNEYGIYDMNNYENVRPILSEYLDDYNIIQTKDDYNKEILLQHNREQNEIAKNMGEISITRDPRITKYEDTYSITPYANFKIMDTTETDIDIVKSLDHCKGEWVNVDRCNINKPCKRILQEYIIKNPNYTGDDCREDRERVRDGDTRMIYCNDNNRCNGHGKCNGYDVCSCDSGWGGDNCDVACPEKNCNNGKAIAPDCKCECDSGYSGPNCDECILIDNNCNNHGKVNHATCSCECDSGYSGPNCMIKEVCKPENLSLCINGDVTGYISDGCECSCKTGYTGPNCEYNCNTLKNELIDFEKNYPNKLIYFTNGATLNGFKINDIINIDQITGIYFNLLHNAPLDITLWLNAYTYIFENKILEKIFECCKNINYIEIQCYSYKKEFDDIIISIFDILKIYNLLNYVKYETANANDLNTINLLVTISKKYYDMPYRELIMTDGGYFFESLLPAVYFTASGIDEHILTKNCLLKTKLEKNVLRDGQKVKIWHNKYIPFEYFKDC